MVKAHVLLYDDNNVYFPVKAALNPYDGTAAYCAGSPQFFGGRVGYETQRAALRRETAEESQLTYLLDNSPLMQLYEVFIGPPDDGEDYFFYASDARRNPAQRQWPPDLVTWQAYPPEFREMCCIVNTPIAGLITALGVPPGVVPQLPPWQLPGLPTLAAALVDAAVAGAPGWAQPQVRLVPSEEFLASETLVAFACFVLDAM